MKFLIAGNGNQYENKERATNLYLNLNPQSEKIDGTKYVADNEYAVNVSAYTDPKAAMLVNTDSESRENAKNKKLPDWISEIDKFVAVREMRDGRIIMFEIRDFDLLASFLGKDCQTCAVTWENIKKASCNVTIIKKVSAESLI